MRNTLGRLGEHTAWQRFTAMGFDVERVNTYFSGDMRVNGFNVEVKLSTRNKDGKYRATLDKQGHQSCIYADFIFWQILDEQGVFWNYVVPRQEIKTKRLVICSHPATTNSKLNRYLFNYGALKCQTTKA